MKYSDAYLKAKEMATRGEDPGDLICQMTPNETLMLRIFVRNQDPQIAQRHIYGRAVHNEIEKKVTKHGKSKRNEKKRNINRRIYQEDDSY